MKITKKTKVEKDSRTNIKGFTVNLYLKGTAEFPANKNGKSKKVGVCIRNQNVKTLTAGHQLDSKVRGRTLKICYALLKKVIFIHKEAFSAGICSCT